MVKDEEMADVIAGAFAFAAHAAVRQVRKYTGERYIQHPREVALTVSAVPSRTEEMLCAAWLHDVVEDTGVTIEDIKFVFGSDVAKLVDELTDKVPKEAGNRPHRVKLERERIASISPEAKTIKLADLISNTASIAEHDPAFANVYLREKQALLEVLKEGDKVLWARAWLQIETAIEKMKEEE